MNPAVVKNTPAYVADVSHLKKNIATAARIKQEAGCKILLATKAFSTSACFPYMRDTLDGTTASGLFEARLGREEFGKEVHVFSPAYTDDELQNTLLFADHVYFNSIGQLKKFQPLAHGAGKELGIRFNPGYSKVTLGGALYDPCSPNSRFGIQASELANVPWEHVSILHAHALCEAMDDGSTGLIDHIARNFGDYVRKVKTVNFGGGHFINKPGYNVDALIKAIKDFRAAFNVDVILEPGGALVYGAGYLVATVIDVLERAQSLAILDTSATCHMPDVLEVPFRPEIVGAGEDGEFPYSYIIGGKTCMTGDVIGTYSFEKPLKAGDRLIFKDALQYSIVKNNTFNGTPLPDIVLLNEDGSTTLVKSFGYDDFRNRLG